MTSITNINGSCPSNGLAETEGAVLEKAHAQQVQQESQNSLNILNQGADALEATLHLSSTIFNQVQDFGKRVTQDAVNNLCVPHNDVSNGNQKV